MIAIRDERETIGWADIVQAKQLKEHGLPDDHEYIERERHSVAVHEACHAVVAYRLRTHMTIDIATIERRGDVGGFVSSIPPEDQFVQWRSERDIDVMTFLASLAGERLFFDGDHSTGVGGDMRGATDDRSMHGARVLRDGPTRSARTVGEPRGLAGRPARRGRHRPSDARRRVRQAGRGRSSASSTSGHGRCSRRTAPRSSRSRTRSRPTRRSRATTWPPSSRDMWARSSTAAPTTIRRSASARALSRDRAWPPTGSTPGSRARSPCRCRPSPVGARSRGSSRGDRGPADRAPDGVCLTAVVSAHAALQLAHPRRWRRSSRSNRAT